MKKYVDLVSSFTYTAQKQDRGITYITNSETEYNESYSEVYAASCKCLYGLQKMGMSKGDKLIFQLEEVDDFIHIFWACILGGIIPVPIATAASDENYLLFYNIWEKVENPYIVSNEQAFQNYRRYLEREYPQKAELATEKFIDSKKLLAEEKVGKIINAEPTDIAMIQFSSGSTGAPKGAEITHENIMLVVEGVAEKEKLTDSDTLMSWLPLTHNLGLIVMHILPLVKGLEQYIMPKSLFVYNPVCYMDKVSKYHPSVTASPNFGFKYLMSIAAKGNFDWDLSSIRIIWNGAEPIDAQACQAFIKTMQCYGLKENVIYPGYGMTEATVVITVLDIEKNFTGINLDRNQINIGEKIREVTEVNNNTITFVDVGSALPSCELRICDDDNSDLGEDRIGHIQVRGKTVMRGYYNDSAATNEMFAPDGWLKTGDIGFLRNGGLIITGRAKELILINGQNYYPNDIERLCERVEGVKPGKVAASGVYNRNTKEDSIAVFIEDAMEDNEFMKLADEIKVTLNSHGIWKVDFITQIEAIPKTDSGKIKRNELKKRFENNEFKFYDTQRQEKAIQADNDVTPIENELLKIFSQIDDSVALDVEDSFFAAGFSSLQLIKIAEVIKEKFNATVTVSDIFSYSTVQQLARYLHDLAGVRKETASEEDKEDKNKQDIAIIGLDCRFPGAGNAKEYWMNLKAGIDCIGEYPEGRRNDVKNYIHAIAKDFTEKELVEGGYLDEIAGFDYSFFKIMPKEAELLNPCQRLFLQSAYKALEDSGYITDEGVDNKIGVYVGASKSIFDYERLVSLSIRDNHSDYAVGNLYSMISGRVSYALDLKGPSVTIDTACSSSLTAVHIACKAIQNGECDMAAAGGVRVNLLPVKTKIGIEASDCRAKAFDDSSDGTGCGEGVGVVILKSLEQAQKDHDNIYAVIKGSAVNQDGKTAGITAPNSLSQTELLCNAWKDAKIDPAALNYIEAHGTGTKLGDPIEIEGISRALGRYTDKKEFCAVGSVKSNIGHLFEAAGIASLIKVVLMERYGMIPPLVHFKKINERIKISGSPVYIADKLQSCSEKGKDFKCGISSFGFSGTNCHVVLEGHEKRDLGIKRKCNIFTISAKTEKALINLAKEYTYYLQEEGAAEKIENICYMSTSRRKHFEYRLAIVVHDNEELLNKLGKFLEKRKSEENELIYYGIHKVINNDGIKTRDYEITRDERARLAQEAEQLNVTLENNEADEKSYTKLARYYVQGAPISWGKVYSGEVYSKISIPTYCFEKHRCWIDIIEDRGMEMSDEVQKRDGNFSSVKGRIVSMVCSVSGLKEQDVDINEQFISMGIDSMGLMQIKNSVRNIYKIDIPVNDLFNGLSSVAKLAEYLQSNSIDEGEKEESLKDNNDYSANSLNEIKQKDTTGRTYSNIMADGNAKTIIDKQLDIMRMQLSLLNNAEFYNDNTVGDVSKAIDKENNISPKAKNMALPKKSGKVVQYRPYQRLNFAVHEDMTDRQEAYIQRLIEKYCTKTAGSKNDIQNYRKVYANNRNVAGFRPIFKEMVYQLVSPRAKGSKIWDVDGNEYIDLTMGFGVNLFGHNPEFVTDALEKQLKEGFSLGPMSHLAGRVAEKICTMTGVERVAFYNSGTEADMVALRIARAVTRRDKAVIFAGSYHGTFDGVLGVQGMDETDTMTMAPGILNNMVNDIYVLNYGTEESLTFIKNHMEEIAAVMVEPVQSRRPDFRPVEFIKKLREITEEGKCALIFDEVITGFRICNGGAQEWYGVTADLATYGKIIGGGMPIGVVAGKSKFMDSIDGGYWSFGDHSCPPNEEIRTFVAGTFCHHPMAMAAADAVLTKLAEENIQNGINQKTEKFVNKMNDFFANEGVPIHMVCFGSLFRFVLNGDLELFYYVLVSKGVYIWEGRNCFFSSAHTEQDIENIEDAIYEAIYELRENGFLESSKKKTIVSEYPLTDAQREISDGISMSCDVSLCCNESVVLNLSGNLVKEALEKAISTVHKQHDALSMAVDIEKGRLIYQSKACVVPDYIEMEEGPRLDSYLSDEVSRPFELDKAPLYRLAIVKTGVEKFKLLFVCHHIMIDGWSMNVFINELAEAYTAFANDFKQKAGDSMQFVEYLEWKRKVLYLPEKEEAVLFWRDKFSSIQERAILPRSIQMNGDRIAPEAIYSFKINEGAANQLDQLAKKNGNTLFTMLLSIFVWYLHRLTARGTVIVGIPFADQSCCEGYSLIGMCDSILPLCINVEEQVTFSEHMQRVKNAFLEINRYQKYSLSNLVEGLDISKVPDIDIVFNLDKVFVPLFDKCKTEIGTQLPKISSNSIFVNIMQINSELDIQFKYNPQMFDGGLIEEWISCFREMMEDVAEGLDGFLIERDFRLDRTEKLLNERVAGSIILPQSQTEKILWNIWKDILGKSVRSITEDFFTIGGNSLKLSLLRGKVAEQFEILPDWQELFRCRTIQSLGKYLDSIGDAGNTVKIERTPYREYYPVTSGQKEIFISSMLDPQSTKNNICGAILINEGTDKIRLSECINKIADRHDILQSSFYMTGQDVYQKVNEKRDVEVYDLRADSLEEAEKCIDYYNLPFDLEKGYLMRVLMISLPDERMILACIMHHIVADGTSSMIFLNELIQRYQGKRMEPLPITYKDFAVHANRMMLTEQYNRQKSYWMNEYCMEITKLILPFRNSDGEKGDIDNSNTVIAYAKEGLSDEVKKFAKMQECSEFMVMFAAYQILLSRYGNTNEIITAVPCDSRCTSETENLIGMFVNTLYIRNEVDGEQMVCDFLDNVKQKVIGAMNNQDYPADALINELHLERDGIKNPLTNYLFSMQSNLEDIISIYGVQYEVFETKAKEVDFDIAFNYMTDNGKLKFIIDYDKNLYCEKDIRIFTDRYIETLTNLAADKNRRVMEISMLTKEEEHKILNTLCIKAPEQKNDVIKTLFEKQAEDTPLETAVTYIKNYEGSRAREENLNYQELNEKSNKLARILRQKGIGEGTSVGIFFESSLELIIALLAVFKAGAAYLPLYPELPADRIKYMMGITDTKFILTHEMEHVNKKLHQLSEICACEIIDISGLEQVEDGSNLEDLIDGSSIAYTIFTSGTTGTPKGVQITHQSIGKTISWRKQEYGFNKEDSILQLFSYAFDGFLTSALTPIICGSRLILLDQEHMKDPLSILHAVQTEKVTHFIAVPTLFSALLSLARKEELESLKYVTLAGERVTRKLVGDCKALNPAIELVNEYGPTENTVVTTIKRNLRETENITIGKAVCGSSIYILDRHMNLRPIETEGEIYIGGDRLTEGYLKDEEKTNISFVSNPYVAGDRLYKTGDMGKWTKDGAIDFIGRNDSQIKIRGYRVELGEVENRILEHEKISNCVVLAELNKQNNFDLYAYYTADCEMRPEEVKQYLRQLLPDYMVPAYMLQIKQIPYTSVGKADRKILLEYRTQFSDSPAGIQPETENEVFLCGIWERVLGIDKVFADQNFFEIGGDSIKAIQIVALCRQQGIEIAISDIMHKQTVREMALCMKSIEVYSSQQIVTGEVDCTPIQKWFVENITIDREHFNQTVLLENKHGFQAECLEKVMRELIEHHDALRTSFEIGKNGLLQNMEGFNERQEVLAYEDITQEADCLQYICDDSNNLQRSFQLKSGQMVKAKLYHSKDTDYLFIAIHHLVIDGVSWRILLEDLAEAYDAAVCEKEYKFPQKTTSFKSWAKALKKYAGSYQVLQEKKYWEQTVSHKYKSLTVGEAEYGSIKDETKYETEIGKEKTGDVLYKINKIYGTNTQEILFAAFARALTKTFGKNDYLIDVESHGREEISSDINVVRTIGWFTSQYPFGVYSNEVENIKDAIINIKERFRKVPKNGIGYGLLQYSDKAVKLKGTKPDIVFNFLGHISKGKDTDQIRVVEFNYGKTCSEKQERHHLISFDAIVQDDVLKVSITYNGAVIKDEIIQFLALAFSGELDGIVQHCKKQKKTINTPSDYKNKVISIEELQRLLNKYENNIEQINELPPMQKGMIFDQRMNPGSSIYFEQVMLELEGQVRTELLEKSFQMIIDRHDALRSCYNYEDCSQPQQIVLKEYRFKIQGLDITGSKDDLKSYLLDFCKSDIANGFSIDEEVPMRMFLLKARNNMNYLVWSFHHILMDGWCIDLILEELVNIYTGMLKGETVLLPAAPSYSVYAEWIKSRNEQAALKYWKNYLQGYHGGSQTKDPLAAEVKDFKREEYRFAVDNSCIEMLKKIAGDSRITMAALFQALWGIILGKYSGKEEVVYGVVVSGRSPEIMNVESVVGLFINTLPLRIRLPYEASLVEIAKTIQDDMEKHNQYSYLSLAQIQSLCMIKGELFDNMFSFENYANYNNYRNRLSDKDKLGFVLNKVTEFEQTIFNLTFIVEPKEDGYEFNIIYNGNTCDMNLLDSIKGYLTRVMEQLINDHQIIYGDIALADGEEMEDLLNDFMVAL
ncbi:iturin family lipopeptide synthetase A [Kineothrix alysoides]|uniref:Iturin family lipopeptide synthetase A n=1 Tax=Kineothrix alysoides TaxID=1469948 RepID=A0A4R1QVI9_9FIRM|nr:non-ribosomal peptide synthetase [Kineothrix alysoides]TCL57597.1 iturin family lipopeptide synthetase A [Kineothrix alysoides]